MEKKTELEKNPYEKIRNDWGNVKPYTRVFPDKRKKKPKHKLDDKNYEE